MIEVSAFGFRGSFSFFRWFRFIFLCATSFSFTFVFVLLIYLFLLSLCVRRFGPGSFWWNICCVVRSCVCFYGYSASGECILRVSTHFRLRFLSFGLVLVGYLFVFRLTFVPAFTGLSVHAFIEVYHSHPVGRLNPS